MERSPSSPGQVWRLSRVNGSQSWPHSPCWCECGTQGREAAVASLGGKPALPWVSGHFASSKVHWQMTGCAPSGLGPGCRHAWDTHSVGGLAVGLSAPEERSDFCLEPERAGGWRAGPEGRKHGGCAEGFLPEMMHVQGLDCMKSVACLGKGGRAL